MAPRRLRTFGIACLALIASAATSRLYGAAEAEEPKLPLTAYMVWVSRNGSKDLPKELKPFQERLKKAFRGGAFRLHGKPFSGELAPGKTLSLDLPQGYGTRWRIADEKSREPAVRQTLVNPRKLETVALIKRSPAIIHLERIREGEETFVLIVTFGKTAKPEKNGA